MRLTLRTLLAYLDDILEPAEAKEIGKKLQESPMAMALVSRIREVVRRRRLGAPDLDGPAMGIDPNLVAQYIDNTLTPQQVAEIEKICLESDQKLAEVAACHQVISLALGNRVEISAASRERLYVLGPVDASEKLQGGDGVPQTHGERWTKTPVSVQTIPGSAGQSFEESLPDYLKTKSWSGKTIPIFIGVALLCIWLASFLLDQNLQQGIQNIRHAPKPSVVADQPIDEEGKPDGEMVAAVVPDPNSKKPSPEPVPPVKPTDPGEKPAVEVAAVDDPPADAMPDEPAPRPGTPPASDDPAPAVEAGPQFAPVAVQLVSAEGILLRFNPNDKSWYVVPRLSEIKAGVQLACPEPFEMMLEIDHGVIKVTLLGDTLVELLPANELAPATLRLVSGRIIVQSSQRGEKSAPLGFAIGPRTGRLEFADADCVAGIEFLAKEPAGFEQPVALQERTEGMCVLNGGVRWMPEGEPLRGAVRGQYLALLGSEPPLNFGTPSGTVPDWLDPQKRKSSSVLRRFAKQFEKEFEANQSIDSSMRALIADPRPRVSELAVRCLTLTHHDSAVVQAMAQVEHEDARKAALTGLKHWLGEHAGHGEQLKPMLAAYYEREDDMEALYRLLWGISESEARDETVSLKVVEWLRSEKVEIRELAFGHLVRLTGRKYDYRPLASASQREPAVKRWFDHLDREGGAILKSK